MTASLGASVRFVLDPAPVGRWHDVVTAAESTAAALGYDRVEASPRRKAPIGATTQEGVAFSDGEITLTLSADVLDTVVIEAVSSTLGREDLLDAGGEFLDALSQRFAQLDATAQAEDQGWRVVEEQRDPDGSVRVRYRKEE